MSDPVVMQVMASSVKIADRAGQIVRDIMAKGELGIKDDFFSCSATFLCG